MPTNARSPWPSSAGAGIAHKDAEIVVVGSDGPRLDLLLDARRVDVAIMHAPEPFQAAKRGWTLVEDLGRLDVAFQNSCAATTRRLIAARPDLALRYVRAYLPRRLTFRTDAAFGTAVLRKYTGETDDRGARTDLAVVRPPDGRDDVPSVEGMRTASQVLVELGAIPRPIPPEDSIDLGVVAAVEREGYFATVLGLGAGAS